MTPGERAGALLAELSCCDLTAEDIAEAIAAAVAADREAIATEMERRWQNDLPHMTPADIRARQEGGGDG